MISPGLSSEVTGEKKFAQTMIIPPREEEQRLSVPPIGSQRSADPRLGVRENGAWISLFAALAVLLVAVTVTAARHTRPVSRAAHTATSTTGLATSPDVRSSVNSTLRLKMPSRVDRPAPIW